MEEWGRPASVLKTCLPAVVCEGGAGSVKGTGRLGDGEILKIVDWEPFCEQSEQNVSRAGLSEGLRERVIADLAKYNFITRLKAN